MMMMIIMIIMVLPYLFESGCLLNFQFNNYVILQQKKLKHAINKTKIYTKSEF